LALTLYGSQGHAHAVDVPAEPLVRKTIFGVLLHDRGPFSDRNENGVDPNWKLELNPPKWSAWRWLGSPEPILGVTPNFSGDTSAFYAGLNYELSLSNRWTDELILGLTKHIFVGASNKNGCKEESDCGFGYRVLPRLGFEVGGYFSAKQGISIFYDHMSHKDILPGENEGLDHIGIRYHFLFNRR
jgi:lipid A 3-O-deacylase